MPMGEEEEGERGKGLSLCVSKWIMDGKGRGDFGNMMRLSPNS